MANLPTDGSSEGTWGADLNTFLEIAHNGDGTLKTISHTVLSNIGSKTHAQLDTHLNGSGSDHSLLGATPGTAEASKAVVLDSNKDITGINDLTADNEISAGVRFDVGGSNGISPTIVILDGDGKTTHTITVIGGIVTNYTAK